MPLKMSDNIIEKPAYDFKPIVEDSNKKIEHAEIYKSAVNYGNGNIRAIRNDEGLGIENAAFTEYFGADICANSITVIFKAE